VSEDLTKRDFKGERIVVWPEYLDSTRTRGMGRRVSLAEAVKKPSLHEVYNAALDLGLNAETVEAKYPRNWMYSRGYVLVDKRYPKTKLLRLIAGKIREHRSSR
jgi:signal recognition particle subunit SRP19